MPTHNTELVRQLTYAIASDMTMHLHTGPVGTGYTTARVPGDPTVTISAGEWEAIDEAATEVTYGRSENFGVLSTTAAVIRVNWTLFRGNNPAYTGAFPGTQAERTVPANTPFEMNANSLLLDADSLI